MEDNFVYHVYSAKGWWLKSSTWGSTFESAKPLTVEDAIDFCRKHRSPDQSPAMPVRLIIARMVLAK